MLSVCVFVSIATAAPLPDGFEVVAKSPDGKLGVLVPDTDHLQEGVRQNAVVELATGKVVATIAADTIFQHESHADIRARWSGSTLVWYVDGKWGSYALVVLTFDHGVHQFDVREAAVAKALAAMRAARPKVYADVKALGGQMGSWYRDGFAIDVRPANPGKPGLPLAIVIEMTSNPKEMDDVPTLEGNMTGTVGVDGNLTVSKLTLKVSGQRAPS
jgi:hypothetical protein